MRTLVVVAAVVERAGRVLVTRRREGTHLGGLWEFPGGKVDEGEDPRDALARELREEVGVAIEVGDVLDVAFHRYTERDRAVLLLFYDARLAAGSPEPRAIEVAELAWALPGTLDPAEFPPADVGVVAKLRARAGRAVVPE